MKSHDNGARTSGPRSDTRAAHGKTIVRTGHPALDLAIAMDRDVSPTLNTLRDACRRGTAAAPLPHAEAPAVSSGRPVSAMALTMDRTGRGPALHVATKHTVVDARRRTRTITVWHELATFDAN